MKIFRLFVISIFLSQLFVLEALAQTNEMTFRKIHPCLAIGGPWCEERILAEGVITSKTPQRFRNFMSTAGKGLGTISFNSPGGDLIAAMQLGEEIRKRKLNSYQARRYTQVIYRDGRPTLDKHIIANDAVCASACFLAFLGGIARVIAPDALLGVHQFYGGRRDLGQSATQTLSVLTSAYLENMGVSRQVLDIASLVPPERMHWLTEQELKILKVDTSVKVNSPWMLNVSNENRIFTSSSLPLSSDPFSVDTGYLTVAFFNVDGQVAMTLQVVVFDSGIEANIRDQVLGSLLNQLNTWPQSISFSNGGVANMPKLRWVKGASNSFSTSFILQPDLLDQFRESRIFTVDFMFPRALDGLDPSGEFVIGDLPQQLSAIKR